MSGDIHEKSGLSQSTISEYLAMMQKAELLESTRHGKWIYYRRNEETLAKLAGFIKSVAITIKKQHSAFRG